MSAVILPFPAALAQFQQHVADQAERFISHPGKPTKSRVVHVITGIRTYGHKHGHDRATTAAAVQEGMRALARDVGQAEALRIACAHADELHKAMYGLFGSDVQ